MTTGTVTWTDLSSDQLEGSKSFYAELFGWEPFVVSHSPSGGYTVFLSHGKQVAALGPAQPWQPSPAVWSLYFATVDAEATASLVRDARGKVVTDPTEMMGMGRRAVFQDPTGACFSVWESAQRGFEASEEAGAYAWAELNTRDLGKARAFYQKVFGWSSHANRMGSGQPPYTQFQLDGKSVAGGVEMKNAGHRAAHWLIYFGSFDVDATTKKAIELGGRVLVEPLDFPGGRSSIVSDPQGATFGLLRTSR